MGHFSRERFYFLLLGGGKSLSVRVSFFTVCQVTLIQNNQYAKMAYFGLTYSVPIQETNLKICLEKQEVEVHV